MKGLISFVFEIALLVGIGTVGFNQMYKETKMTALKKVGEGTVSLIKLNEKLTGRPNQGKRMKFPLIYPKTRD